MKQNDYRSFLIPVAYNMTGSLEDAEDIVQDVMVNWLSVNIDKVSKIFRL